ncbi:MAG: hypothetical protein ACJA1N_000473 [Saprospiraceae bacterium]|jgi:hypothetical protein
MKYISILALAFLMSCNNSGINTESENFAVKTSFSNLDSDLKDYWYNGEAEISSYELSQARYGEMHEGKAVLIFVTEHFSPKSGTKADNPKKDAIPVLKLNATKKFNTGIYPYSMMNSTFFPFENGEHSIKITNTSQEWCGHTFMELENKSKFKVSLESYFEGESFENKTLAKANLEDDIWSKIRLNPTDLPTGKMEMIPSFFYLRLRHTELKAYEVTATLSKIDAEISQYSINYPTLNRTLNIQFETAFPYKILGWDETYKSGFGENTATLTTTAKRIKTIKSDYWNKHNNSDKPLRKELGLE